MVELAARLGRELAAVGGLVAGVEAEHAVGEELEGAGGETPRARWARSPRAAQPSLNSGLHDADAVHAPGLALALEGQGVLVGRDAELLLEPERGVERAGLLAAALGQPPGPPGG